MRAARAIAIGVVIVVLAPIMALGALILFVESEQGERWISERVASHIHREVQVEGIDVRVGWPPSVSAARLRIGNPEWANTTDLVDVRDAAVVVDVLPLLSGEIVLPVLTARTGTAGIEQSAGRATWRFDAAQVEPSRVHLGRIVLDDGHIIYRNVDEDTALTIDVKGTVGEGGEVRGTGKGRFRGEPARGTATMPGLKADTTQPVHFLGHATVGKTVMDAEGAVGPLLENVDVKFHLAGHTLKDLHKVFRLVLPDTPQYTLAGRLRHVRGAWVFDPFQGKVGDSDLGGDVTVRKGEARPMFVAHLRSKMLDFKDLGPVIGTPRAEEHAKTSREEAEAQAMKASDRVLPRRALGTERWRSMDADVHLVAERVLRPEQLPLDSLSTHLVLNDGVLHLDPLDFAMADGRVRSSVTIDSHAQPPAARLVTDVQGMHMGKLFPTVEPMQEAFGTVYGHAQLKGRGASVGDILATSNGKIVLAAEGGRVSALLSHLLEIDLARAAMLMGTRNKQVDLRCAVGNIDVKDGVATPESFVIDTSDTFVNVVGKLDFAKERFDVETKAKGKKPSPLVLHTSILMDGPLKSPHIHPRSGPIVAQAGAAVALAIVTPPLAIAPFLDPGRGKDADCDKLLAEAKEQGGLKKVAAKDDPAG